MAGPAFALTEANALEAQMFWLRQKEMTSLFFVFLLPFSMAGFGFSSSSLFRPDNEPKNETDGVNFTCSLNQLPLIQNEMETYLASLNIDPESYIVQLDVQNSKLNFSLNSPKDDTNTLDLSKRPELNIKDEIIELPTHNGPNRKVSTVSKKEIIYALFQHGRSTDFSGEHCTAEAFIDHVGIRQNTVAWTEILAWNWPNGGSAYWNKKYWIRGTPTGPFSLDETLLDIFKQQKKYAFGCYTATKIAMAQGIVDYYARVKKDPIALRKVTQRLLAKDQEPLVDVEPGKMWFFEDDFKPEELHRPGKILEMKEKIASRNFVPGDWSYFLNTDKITYQKTGYEGSNAIYLGRNKFDDYYDDQKEHSYTFEQKLDEVYQWRNGVFSRSRDFAKIKKLSRAQLEKLTETPDNGGLILDYRVFHSYF